MASISVCIPTYNQSAHVERAVRSAYEQTHKPSEIIVCDDSSTDGTADILDALSAEIPVLRVVRQPNNLGIARNVDLCLRLATGDFVVRLDSDDLLMPEFIERMASALEADPSAGYAHSEVQEIDEYGRPHRVRRLARGPGPLSADRALRAAAQGYKVAANIVMFRRSALEAAGYIGATEDFAEDFYLSAAIADAGSGNCYVDEVLCAYRVWSDAAGIRQHRKLAEIRGVRDVFEDVLEPAFRRRRWGTRILRTSRANLACIHADCLSWTRYSAEEKTELRAALLQLSRTPRARLVCWLYLNDLGWVVRKGTAITGAPRQIARTSYLRLREGLS